MLSRMSLLTRTRKYAAFSIPRSRPRLTVIMVSPLSPTVLALPETLEQAARARGRTKHRSKNWVVTTFISLCTKRTRTPWTLSTKSRA